MERFKIISKKESCQGILSLNRKHYVVSKVENAAELFPKRQILDSSKLKDSANDNFKLDEIGRKLSIQVKNTVGKGEIAPSTLFRLYPQWVLCGPVEKCLTRNPGVLGSSRTGSSGFFRGSVHGQETSEPSLVLVKPRKA